MKPDSHRKVTQYALTLLAKTNCILLQELEHERFREAILDGTTDEDDPSFSRGLNWHFYPANETIKNQSKLVLPFVKVRPTSVRIFKKRQKKLMERLEDGANVALFTSFGQILHHIQDMSTPSHVVPVYHDHDLSDPFETFLTDNWSEIENGLKVEFPQLNPVSEKLGNDVFIKLYKSAAERLLESLFADRGLFPVVLNDNQDIALSGDFWKPYDSDVDSGDIPLDIKGFGTFGPLGASFGRHSSFRRAGEDVRVKPEVFFYLADFYVSHAVSDTLNAMLLLDQLLDFQKNGN